MLVADIFCSSKTYYMEYGNVFVSSAILSMNIFNIIYTHLHTTFSFNQIFIKISFAIPKTKKDFAEGR